MKRFEYYSVKHITSLERDFIYILIHKQQQSSKRKVFLYVLIASILCMALGILFGYLIGKNKYELASSTDCTTNSNKTPSMGMARSDEEKEKYYKNVFAEMKADNIRNNLR